MKARPIAPMLGWAMLYGALIDAAFAWACGRAAGRSRRALGYWLGLALSRPDRLGARLLALFRDHPRGSAPAKAAYSSVLIPIIAMAISTVAEGYRWSPLAMAGGALAIVGLVIALKAGRAAPIPPSD